MENINNTHIFCQLEGIISCCKRFRILEVFQCYPQCVLSLIGHFVNVVKAHPVLFACNNVENKFSRNYTTCETLFSEIIFANQSV